MLNAIRHILTFLRICKFFFKLNLKRTTEAGRVLDKIYGKLENLNVHLKHSDNLEISIL